MNLKTCTKMTKWWVYNIFLNYIYLYLDFILIKLVQIVDFYYKLGLETLMIFIFSCCFLVLVSILVNWNLN